MNRPGEQILIIGSGTTGLLIAQGLKQAGIAFQIDERDSQARSQREWGMSMHWGGEFLASILPPELRARLNTIDADLYHDWSQDKGFAQCNGQTGEVILDMPGKMPRRISRKKLRALLMEGIEVRISTTNALQYDKLLESVSVDAASGSVTATFADGSSACGMCLIGCDGSRSRVREILLNSKQDAEPKDAGCTILNFPYSYSVDVAEKLRDIHPTFKIAYHPRTNVVYLLAALDIDDPNDPTTWKYQNLMSWVGPPYASDLATPASRVQRLKDLGKDFAEPWKTASKSVSEDAIIAVDKGTSWDPRPYHTAGLWNGTSWGGLVTVAGDAAHSMLPHRGQGLNHSLEDASRVLAALISVFKNKQKTLSEAIEEYENEMVARGGKEVETTGLQAAAAHNWEKLMQSPMFRHGANKTQ